MGGARPHRKAILLGVALALMCAACSARRAPMAIARDDYLKVEAPAVAGARTRAQGALLGGVLGAAVAVAVAAATGVDVTPLVTVIGAGVGTLAGATYAEYVIRERQRYANASAYLANRRRALDAQIVAARSFNGALERELTALESSRRDTEEAIEDADEVLRRMRQQIALEEEVLAQTRREGAKQVDLARQEQRLGDLQAEERRLAAHLDRLSGSLPATPVEEGVRRHP